MKQPRIVIDARMVTAQGHGIANYLLDLLAGLKQLQVQKKLPYEIFLLISPSLPADHSLRHYPLAEVKIPFLHPSELWTLPTILTQIQASLYFSPSFSSLWKYPCPHLQTVHDLNHLEFGNIRQKLYYRFVLKKSALSAATLFTVSESAKKEILAWLRVDKKIEITLNAIREPEIVSESITQDILKKFGVEKEKYFFCLSNPKPHKNLDFLKRAYQKSKSIMPLLLSIEGHNEGLLRHTGALSGKELSVLLRHCRAFFFPSLYEGFGRPPLEAAVCERVVIASNIAPLSEAMALIPEQEKCLLDPKQEKAWALAFQKAEKGSFLPVSSLTKKNILAQYSAENSARLVDKAIQRALSGP